MWSLYYSIQQKFVRYYSPFNENVWKKTNGDRNYFKQQKYVRFLLFRSRFSSSARLNIVDDKLASPVLCTLSLEEARNTPKKKWNYTSI